MAKRQRKYKIRIQDRDKLYRTIEPPFSIEFDVSKYIQGGVCDGSITIYNLGQSTRSALYKDLLQTDMSDIRTIEFYAGYETDTTLAQIFRGSVSHCFSYRQNVDFLTVIEFTSGSDFLANTFVRDTIPKGTTYREAVLKLSSLVVGNGSRAVGSFNGVFKRDTPVCGSVDKVIKDYANGQFFFDDDTILCLNENEYLSGVVNTINAESGLLGSPQKEENFIVFDMIFEPRLKMGQQVYLESKSSLFFNGLFKIVGFHHAGTISESLCGTAKTSVRVTTTTPTDNLVSFQ